MSSLLFVSFFLIFCPLLSPPFHRFSPSSIFRQDKLVSPLRFSSAELLPTVHLFGPEIRRRGADVSAVDNNESSDTVFGSGIPQRDRIVCVITAVSPLQSASSYVPPAQLSSYVRDLVKWVSRTLMEFQKVLSQNIPLGAPSETPPEWNYEPDYAYNALLKLNFTLERAPGTIISIRALPLINGFVIAGITEVAKVVDMLNMLSRLDCTSDFLMTKFYLTHRPFNDGTSTETSSKALNDRRLQPLGNILKHVTSLYGPATGLSNESPKDAQTSPPDGAGRVVGDYMQNYFPSMVKPNTSLSSNTGTSETASAVYNGLSAIGKALASTVNNNGNSAVPSTISANSVISTISNSIINTGITPVPSSIDGTTGSNLVNSSGNEIPNTGASTGNTVLSNLGSTVGYTGPVTPVLSVQPSLPNVASLAAAVGNVSEGIGGVANMNLKELNYRTYLGAKKATELLNEFNSVRQMASADKQNPYNENPMVQFVNILDAVSKVSDSPGSSAGVNTGGSGIGSSGFMPTVAPLPAKPLETDSLGLGRVTDNAYIKSQLDPAAAEQLQVINSILGVGFDTAFDFLKTYQNAAIAQKTSAQPSLRAPTSGLVSPQTTPRFLASDLPFFGGGGGDLSYDKVLALLMGCDCEQHSDSVVCHLQATGANQSTSTSNVTASTLTTGSSEGITMNKVVNVACQSLSVWDPIEGGALLSNVMTAIDYSIFTGTKNIILPFWFGELDNEKQARQGTRILYTSLQRASLNGINVGLPTGEPAAAALKTSNGRSLQGTTPSTSNPCGDNIPGMNVLCVGSINPGGMLSKFSQTPTRETVFAVGEQREVGDSVFQGSAASLAESMGVLSIVEGLTAGQAAGYEQIAMMYNPLRRVKTEDSAVAPGGVLDVGRSIENALLYTNQLPKSVLAKSGCVEANTKISGDIAATLEKIESLEMCREKCRENALCLFFSYDALALVCVLFKTVLNAADSVNTYSGPKVCPTLEEIEAAVTNELASTLQAGKEMVQPGAATRIELIPMATKTDTAVGGSTDGSTAGIIPGSTGSSTGVSSGSAGSDSPLNLGPMIDSGVAALSTVLSSLPNTSDSSDGNQSSAGDSAEPSNELSSPQKSSGLIEGQQVQKESSAGQAQLPQVSIGAPANPSVSTIPSKSLGLLQAISQGVAQASAASSQIGQPGTATSQIAVPQTGAPQMGQVGASTGNVPQSNLSTLVNNASGLVQTGQALVEAGSAFVNTVPIAQLYNLGRTLNSNGFFRRKGMMPFATPRLEKQSVLPPPGVGTPSVQCHLQGMTCCVPQKAVQDWKSDPPTLNGRMESECVSIYVSSTQMMCATSSYEGDNVCRTVKTETSRFKVFQNVLVIPGKTMNNASCTCTQARVQAEDGTQEITGSATWEYSLQAVAAAKEETNKGDKLASNITTALAVAQMVGDTGAAALSNGGDLLSQYSNSINYTPTATTANRQEIIATIPGIVNNASNMNGRRLESASSCLIPWPYNCKVWKSECEDNANLNAESSLCEPVDIVSSGCPKQEIEFKADNTQPGLTSFSFRTLKFSGNVPYRIGCVYRLIKCEDADVSIMCNKKQLVESTSMLDEKSLDRLTEAASGLSRDDINELLKRNNAAYEQQLDTIQKQLTDDIPVSSAESEGTGSDGSTIINSAEVIGSLLLGSETYKDVSTLVSGVSSMVNMLADGNSLSRHCTIVHFETEEGNDAGGVTVVESWYDNVQGRYIEAGKIIGYENSFDTTDLESCDHVYIKEGFEFVSKMEVISKDNVILQDGAHTDNNQGALLLDKYQTGPNGDVIEMGMTDATGKTVSDGAELLQGSTADMPETGAATTGLSVTSVTTTSTSSTSMRRSPPPSSKSTPPFKPIDVSDMKANSITNGIPDAKPDALNDMVLKTTLPLGAVQANEVLPDEQSKDGSSFGQHCCWTNLVLLTLMCFLF